MSGRSSQRKGREGERELARFLQDHGYDAHPAAPLNYGTLPDVVGVNGLHLEIKRCEQLKIPAWLEQSERDAAKFGDGLPVVIFRRNREPWNITLRLTDFLKIYNIPQKSAECERGEQQ